MSFLVNQPKKATWFGKSRASSGNDEAAAQRPVDKLLVRLGACADVVANHEEVDDEMRDALRNQTMTYESFLNDVRDMHVNPFDPGVIAAMHNVRQFCELIEDELQ